MIFVVDIDGTIIDSSKRHSILLKNILHSHKIEVSSIQLDFYMEYKRDGNSTTSFLTQILKIPETESKLIAKEWVEEIESVEMIKNDCLYKDSIKFLNSISKNNAVYYLSSRQSEKNLLAELKKLDVLQFADFVYISSPSEGYKGKVKFINKIKEKSNDSLTIIGDTEVDYKAAIETEINYFLVNRGFRSKKYWDSKTICSYNDLLEVLEVLS